MTYAGLALTLMTAERMGKQKAEASIKIAELEAAKTEELVELLKLALKEIELLKQEIQVIKNKMS